MPFVFHTKVIQSILDPVAQQVAHLVILHEEAQEGRIVADLVNPVAAVKAAVDNLVNVGRETLKVSKDEILIKDMPPTFEEVEGSCVMLLEAAKGLAAEEQTMEDKNKLLVGARGILQGVSRLLLVYDQAEVRKIIKNCEGVIEYIKVAEVVQSMEELVMFTKNLSPGITNMTKQVDNRSNDLTNNSHATILNSESDQVKKGLPLLLSAMKAFVTLKAANAKGCEDVQENRNFIVGSMTNSIIEIIRVLKLTSPTEEPGALVADGDSQLSTGGAPPGSIAAKVFQAKELLQETGKNPETDEAGIASVRACTSEARKIASSFSPTKRAQIEGICDEIDSMVTELAALQARGLGSSAAALAISSALAQKLDELEKELKVGNTEEVINTFKDPLGPLNQLTQAAQASLDTPGREEAFATKSAAFSTHSDNMAATAMGLAKGGGIMDKTVVEDMMASAGKVKKLGPQVVHAAKVLFNNPDNEAAKELYSKVQEEYKAEVDKLTKLVNYSVDPLVFVDSSEKKIKSTLEEAEALMRSGNNPQKAFQCISDAARVAKHVVTVVECEKDNTEDPTFSAQLDSSNKEITAAIAPVVQTARTALGQASNTKAIASFADASTNLVNKVHDAHGVLDAHYNPPPPPPPPVEELPPSRPPLPVEPEPVEEEEEAPLQSSNPIGFAAHQLHQEAKQWEDKDNNMVSAAKRMAKLMMQMAKFAKGEAGEVTSKKEFIATAKMIAKESEEVVKMAKMVANACTDKRMKRTLLQTVDAIPTIATQLKIIAAVKATRQGGDDKEADREATEMLTDNAQNLMKVVSEVLYATEAASIRVPPESRGALAGLTWVKR